MLAFARPAEIGSGSGIKFIHLKFIPLCLCDLLLMQVLQGPSGLWNWASKKFVLQVQWRWGCSSSLPPGLGSSKDDCICSSSHVFLTVCSDLTLHVHSVEPASRGEGEECKCVHFFSDVLAYQSLGSMAQEKHEVKYNYSLLKKFINIAAFFLLGCGIEQRTPEAECTRLKKHIKSVLKQKKSMSKSFPTALPAI